MCSAECDRKKEIKDHHHRGGERKGGRDKLDNTGDRTIPMNVECSSCTYGWLFPFVCDVVASHLISSRLSLTLQRARKGKGKRQHQLAEETSLSRTTTHTHRTHTSSHLVAVTHLVLNEFACWLVGWLVVCEVIVPSRSFPLSLSLWFHFSFNPNTTTRTTSRNMSQSIQGEEKRKEERRGDNSKHRNV